MNRIVRIFTVISLCLSRALLANGDTQITRDFPIYATTDIHMNAKPLEGITKLTDGIVLVNGDIVTGVQFDHERRCLGSGADYIQPTQKDTWTDPLRAIEILKTRHSQYPLIASLGNHELYFKAYEGSVIKDKQVWIQALNRIGVVPLSTFPNFEALGAQPFFPYGNSCFLSYITCEYGMQEVQAQSSDEYIERAVTEMTHQIQKSFNINRNINEIYLMLHAGFNEGSHVVWRIIQRLGDLQSKGQLNFDLWQVSFVYCLGHHHDGSDIPEEYRNEEYWDGHIEVPINEKTKKVWCIFPHCADDCIKIDTDGTRSVKTRFFTDVVAEEPQIDTVKIDIVKSKHRKTASLRKRILEKIRSINKKIKEQFEKWKQSQQHAETPPAHTFPTHPTFIPRP